MTDGLRVDLGSILREQVARQGNRPFLTWTEDGTTLSYAEFGERVHRVANGLAGLGIERGDRVNVMLPNRPEGLIISYALRTLGAVEVAINAEFRGPSLARMLELAGARVLVADAALLEHVAEVGDGLTPSAVTVIVGTPTDEHAPGKRVAFYDELCSSPADDPGVEVSDLEATTVIFTSGTTGPSKGCMIPHRALVRGAELMRRELDMRADDVFYTAYPLFHARAAYLDVLPTLMVGGHVVLAPRFSASRFWSHMREHDVSLFSIIGTVQTILWKQEPSEAERDHRVRLTWGGPLPISPEAFEQRFGIPLLPPHGVYGMSETGMVSMTSFDLERSGRVVASHEVRIGDDEDDPLPIGETGEILVRSREPGVMFTGYLGMAEETVEANRNLWFHTGDLGRIDAGGRLTFLGRKREMIRRGGHNISTWEIEEVAGTHDDVLEAAALGVPSELGEEEVKLFVVVRADSDLDGEAIVEFCRGRMAPFMVPRQVALLEAMPKTPTGKAAKAELLELHERAAARS